MRSTAMIVLGILLIAAGAVVITMKGIPYTNEQLALDIGPVHATAETQNLKRVPPVITGLVIAGGVLLVVLGSRRTSASN